MTLTERSAYSLDRIFYIIVKEGQFFYKKGTVMYTYLTRKKGLRILRKVVLLKEQDRRKLLIVCIFKFFGCVCKNKDPPTLLKKIFRAPSDPPPSLLNIPWDHEMVTPTLKEELGIMAVWEWSKIYSIRMQAGG